MKYEDFNIEDFLKDEFFIHWVTFGDENTVHFWEKWIQQHSEKREIVYLAADIIRSIGYKNKVELNDKLYLETFENILIAEKEEKIVETKKYWWENLFQIRNIAAVFLVSLLFWLSWNVLKSPIKPEIKEVASSEWVTKIVPTGKKSIVTLSDGTKIFLNSKSELSFPKNFSDTLRTVTIKGEAFFEVKKENRLFIVQANGIKINVLGTSFNVREMEDGQLSVALVSGKVRVNDDSGNQVNLNPNEKLVLKENGPFIKTGFDSLEEFGWKSKYLIFKKDNFNSVKKKLENWYGIDVEIKGKVNPNWTYSGIYQDEMLENVLKGIKHTSGINYSIKNKKVIISNIK
ncbi:FecR family protein [Cecembia calidifontis]|jgi:ferric-dicitrate binding protein FerR (iron transport regulator)|uniref:FecR family protein n=1 Tax=Cecembia calidifontis TaxID=1187080 RepID=A0A4Q7P8Q0_9BACT|nr:FecR family protein [Cecembia calidifontis]RZS95102.1 FecR family protein [Cecembia calidifontis]